jgi:endonuclease YncB( thermonuclease family)
MRRPYQILMPLLGLFLVRVDLTDLYTLNLPVKVLKIYDGDTILVGRGSFQSKVRLSKIDAPEKKQPFLIGEGDAGKVSADCLKRLLKKGTHTLRIEKMDIYGRILGDLDDLSLTLVRNGCAPLYPHASFDNQEQKFEFLRALKKAKAAKSGLWRYGGFLQPKKWRKISKRGGHRR